MGMKRNTSCIFETTLGTGVGGWFLPHLLKCFSLLKVTCRVTRSGDGGSKETLT